MRLVKICRLRSLVEDKERLLALDLATDQKAAGGVAGQFGRGGAEDLGTVVVKHLFLAVGIEFGVEFHRFPFLSKQTDPTIGNLHCQNGARGWRSGRTEALRQIDPEAPVSRGNGIGLGGGAQSKRADDGEKNDKSLNQIWVPLAVEHLISEGVSLFPPFATNAHRRACVHRGFAP